MSQEQRWHNAVRQIRANPERYDRILRSVMSSMALEGFKVNEERSRVLFERALDGPPLIYPGLPETPEFDEPLGEPLTAEELAARFRRRQPVPAEPEADFDLPDDLY